MVSQESDEPICFGKIKCLNSLIVYCRYSEFGKVKFRSPLKELTLTQHPNIINTPSTILSNSFSFKLLSDNTILTGTINLSFFKLNVQPFSKT